MNYEDELKIFSNELHKKVIKRFTHKKVYSNYKNEIFSMDLNDMITYKNENNGYIYIFVIEDVYTRKAWAVALKDKKTKTIIEALEKLFKEIKGQPKFIWSDRGGEFWSGEFTKFIKKYNIQQYSVFGESKACMVERLNQTLKHIMFKILTKQQSHNWINILDEVINIYNNNIHSALGISPNEAYKHPNKIKKTEDEELAPYLDIENERPKFKLGDYVRVSRLKGVFEKGYFSNWSMEVFIIVQINLNYPTTYKINDFHGEPIEGIFYSAEIVKTDIPFFALVEKVIKTRKKNGIKEYLVKWMGWGEKFNTYEPAENIKNISV